MKTLKLGLVGIMLVFAVASQAQVAVTVNIGAPPMWGPVGYSGVQYYYLPDVQAYYDVPASMFIYQSGGIWIHRTYLPTRYRNYDLYSGYKVVLRDYHGHTPYNHYKEHKVKYVKGYRGPAQMNIGHKPDHNYSNPPNQGKSNKYKSSGKSEKRNNGKNSGNGNNHGEGNSKKK